MATKTTAAPKQDTKVEQPKEETAIAKANTQALATVTDDFDMERPDFIPQGNTGTEGMSAEDVQIPRLALLQKMSPQVDDGTPEYQEGWKPGEFYNTVTLENFGSGPIFFSIVRRDPPRYIEFRPRSEGGGVIDMDVPKGDPRTKFTRGADGKSIVPKATKFYDYLVVVHRQGQPINPNTDLMALSLKSTSIPVAKALNGLIQMRNAPLHSGVYKLTSENETKGPHTFKQFKIENAGFIKNPTKLEILKSMEAGLKTSAVVIDRRDESPDDTDVPENASADFDPEQM